MALVFDPSMSGLAVLLQGLTAALALWGGVRVATLWQGTGEPRLRWLAGFFLAAAVAWALQAAGALSLEAALADGTLARDRLDGLDLLFWAHHAAWLIALGCGVLAVGRRRIAPAVAPLLLWAEPILRFLEAGVLLYLLVLSVANHRRRRNLGSLQVAAGYVLLLAHQSVYLASAAPLGARAWWTELAAAAGMALLAAAVPRRA